MASFGHFIKTEREKREWTQTEFGAKIGINSSAIKKGIICAIFLGALLVIKISSKLVFDRLANRVKRLRNNFRVTKSMIKRRHKNKSSNANMFKYLAELSAKPIDMR